MKWLSAGLTPEQLKVGIERELALGNIMFQVHPTFPLRIFNYTRTCQFERAWNEITLICRGLVIDDNYNIIARPIPKFFNWEELKDVEVESAKGIIPWGLDYDVFDKADGSLGILFNYEDTWMIASRGSFTSDQAKKANVMLNKYGTDLLIPGYTYCLEIIYPENRIVIDYKGDEKLVLLAVVNNETGDELDIHSIETDFETVEFLGKNLDPAAFKALNTANKEGGVLVFKNRFRMKVKFEDYCAMHAVVTNITSYDVWEHLKAGKPIEDLLQMIPDEIDPWVRAQIDAIEVKFKAIEEYHKLALIPIYKIIAEKVAELDNSYDKGVIFSMIKGKEYDEKIYRKIKPEYEKAYSKLFNVNNTADEEKESNLQ